MNQKESKSRKNKFEPIEEIIIKDPSEIALLVHDKKRIILKFLIQKEYTIRQLSRDAEINPGTIKRHMEDLEKKNLIKFTRQEKNNYGIIMKFYRAVAKKFLIRAEITEKC